MTDPLLLYWFMLPVAAAIATAAMASGIGGAALFSPFFLLVLPALGPEYALPSAAAAIGAALFIELFGFTSGFLGYCRRGLIHFPTGLRILRVALPMAVLGSLLSALLPDAALRASYAVLMLGLAAVSLVSRGQEATGAPQAVLSPHERHRHLRDAAGLEYHIDYRVTPASVAITSLGALLTGLASVGIGEVTVSQLVRRARVAFPVAAATSVLVVIATVGVASLAHVASLVGQGGLGAVPWGLLAWAAPGVVLGGQVGSRLQGRVPQRALERAVGGLFAFIGAVMLAVVAASMR